MQHGSLTTKSRLEGPDVWQFRWSEKGPNGKRIYRKRVIGTIKEFPIQDAARNAVASLITEVNWANLRSTSITMTVAQLASAITDAEWYPVIHCVSFACNGQIGIPSGLSLAMRVRQFTTAGTRSGIATVNSGCSARYVSQSE
jgi:hypothetical protein